MSLTYKTTTNENLRLIQFKLMARIYYTTDKLNTFNNNLSAKCLHCAENEDSLMHAFWHCIDMKDSRESIERWLSKHTKNKIVGVGGEEGCVCVSLGGRGILVDVHGA